MLRARGIMMVHRTAMFVVVAAAAGAIVSAQDCHDWPKTCPGTVPRMKQTWLMNESTIIMPCNDTGFTDPQRTLGELWCRAAAVAAARRCRRRHRRCCCNQSTSRRPPPANTPGWSIVDFDWSNAKGTGTADGWAKHHPMDDEELLLKQAEMTSAATPGTTVWVYRNSVYVRVRVCVRVLRVCV